MTSDWMDSSWAAIQSALTLDAETNGGMARSMVRLELARARERGREDERDDVRKFVAGMAAFKSASTPEPVAAESSSKCDQCGGALVVTRGEPDKLPFVTFCPTCRPQPMQSAAAADVAERYGTSLFPIDQHRQIMSMIAGHYAGQCTQRFESIESKLKETRERGDKLRQRVEGISKALNCLEDSVDGLEADAIRTGGKKAHTIDTEPAAATEPVSASTQKSVSVPIGLALNIVDTLVADQHWEMSTNLRGCLVALSEPQPLVASRAAIRESLEPK